MLPFVPRLLAGAALAAALLLPSGARAQQFFPPGVSLMIEEHGVFVSVSEPAFHFAAARRDFESGRWTTAADEIRRGAAGVAFLATRAAGERRKQLEEKEAELHALSRRVREKQVEGIEELDRSFSAALAALRQRTD